MSRPLLVEIIAMTALAELLPASALTGARGSNGLVRIRQRAMYLARRLRPDVSYPRLGAAFGSRDHTTVIHAVSRVEARIAGDPEERARVEAVIRLIGQPVGAS